MFINMLEEVIEKGKVLHTCSWDITRAFDSVSKNVMRMAWARLGVPQEWADWLVRLDEDGMTAVRTPHAIRVWNKSGRKGFTHTKTRTRKRDRQGGHEMPTDNQTTDETAAGFTPQRGTGQGDVMSPACWAAVFDILLTALELDEENNGTTWVGADANAGYKGRDTAYADDLLSTTRDAGRLQRKADVVSAFCSIMGLQISTTKLRRFILGTQGLKDDDTRGDTIVHTFRWEAE